MNKRVFTFVFSPLLIYLSFSIAQGKETQGIEMKIGEVEQRKLLVSKNRSFYHRHWKSTAWQRILDKDEIHPVVGSRFRPNGGPISRTSLLLGNIRRETRVCMYVCIYMHVYEATFKSKTSSIHSFSIDRVASSKRFNVVVAVATRDA